MILSSRIPLGMINLIFFFAETKKHVFLHLIKNQNPKSIVKFIN